MTDAPLTIERDGEALYRIDGKIPRVDTWFQDGGAYIRFPDLLAARQSPDSKTGE